MDKINAQLLSGHPHNLPGRDGLDNQPHSQAPGNRFRRLGHRVRHAHCLHQLPLPPEKGTSTRPHHRRRAAPGAILAVLSTDNPYNEAIIKSAASNPDKKPVVFLFLFLQKFLVSGLTAGAVKG